MGILSKRFLLITFLIMGLCWGCCVVCSILGVGLMEFPLLYIPYVLGGLSPTIASFIAQRMMVNPISFQGWLKSIFDLKQSIWGYLSIPVLAAAFFVPLCLVCGYDKGVPLFALVFMIPMMLFGGGLEETGWRGLLQPELEKKCGYPIATVLVSVIWWFWHLPLFFIRGASQYGGDFLAFGVNIVGLSFALAAIKRCTKSTWLCVLFHCLINSLHGVFIVKESILGSFVASAALIVASYVLVCVKNKRKSV